MASPRYYGALLFSIPLILAAAGCGDRERGGGEIAALRVPDDSGRIVTLVRRPERLVSLAPSVTETIFFLGAGEKLVGVTTQCDWPPAARGIAKVGDFSSPNLERIVELAPDLVVTTSLEQERWTQRLLSLDIPVFTLYPNNCEEMLEGMERLLEILGETCGGPDSLRALRGELDEIGESIRGSGERAGTLAPEKPRVFLEISQSPLMTAGRDSFVSDLLERAGGSNIFGILERDYCIVSSERVVGADPEAIFILHDLSSKQDLSERLGWEKIEAVRTGRVYDDVDPDLVLRPGPRAVRGIRALSERLHGQR
jgi:iron complex transport system substrate-binding protein